MTDEIPKKPKVNRRTPEERARWQAIKPFIVPTQLLNPVNALEAVVPNLEPLLNHKAKRKKSFVARYAESMTPEDTKKAFEDIIAKAERVCRHARKERGMLKENYDITILQPLLDKANDDKKTKSVTEHAVERGGRSRPLLHFRAQAIEPIRNKVRNYAGEFAGKVNAEKIWNAYRRDFSGKSRDELAQVPFMQDFPKTASLIRDVARTYQIQAFLRILDSGSEVKIIHAAQSLVKRLGQEDPLRQGHIGNDLHRIAESNPWQVNPDDITTHASLTNENEYDTPSTAMPHSKSHENDMFSKAREDLMVALQTVIQEKLISYGKFGPGSVIKRRHAAQFNRALLSAYNDDVKVLTKNGRSSRADDPDAQNTSLRSAAHIEPLISYLRAEHALRSIDKGLEKNWVAVADMYVGNLGQGRIGGPG